MTLLLAAFEALAFSSVNSAISFVASASLLSLLDRRHISCLTKAPPHDPFFQSAAFSTFFILLQKPYIKPQIYALFIPSRT